MNSTFRAHRLASSEVISQVLFTSEQPKENKVASRLVIQLVWYILKQFFTSVSMKVVDIYRATIQLHFGEQLLISNNTHHDHSVTVEQKYKT